MTLRVVGPNAQALGERAEKKFAGPGTIGRSAQNDWVLPDPERFISSQHATIEQRGDGFYLVDNSVNGTFVNAGEQPVGHGNCHKLAEGDQLRIGDYEILVSVESATSQSSQWPSHSQSSQWPPQSQSSQWPPAEAPAEDLLAERRSVDPLDHLPGQGAPSRPLTPAPGQGAPGPGPGMGSFTPPGAQRDPFAPVQPDPGAPPPGPHPGAAPAAPAAAGGGIPEDWDKTTMPEAPREVREAAPRPAPRPTPPPAAPPPFEQHPPQPGPGSIDPFAEPPPVHQPPPGAFPGPGAAQPAQPAPQPPPPPPPAHPQAAPGHPGAQPATFAAGGEGGLAELLEAAGLDQATARALATPQTSRMLGYLLRLVIRGMMDVLSARAEIKNQFRVAMTQINATENNPLKFCADETDALSRLLVHQGHGFLGPVEAFEEGFEDVKAHQVAVMAGMRAAFDQLMSRFNPNNLQEEFDRELRRSSLFQPLNKNKYWDMLAELYEDISRDSDANFARLFGDEFARAYEAQMERLGAPKRR